MAAAPSTRRFREAVSFTDNEGEMNGGGFAVYGGGFAVFEEGSVKFAQPDLVTAVVNIVRSPFVPSGSSFGTTISLYGVYRSVEWFVCTAQSRCGLCTLR